ncbi:hypothetical protein [Sinimarinibacterium sp. NLF-5-8]|uniref:hypothetical protein n=1 Tax=Sinimarinibacterium sp. NLF-5-8 TaxID=2698684 RepID=UPI00137C015B|nr:hypothetical protein [Sinimarinibacterium sp. NLF-5-8]QHS09074.1 hypothetical protein GT972_02200 [Sinimarinibacterium sp. NLF-5-8]
MRVNYRHFWHAMRAFSAESAFKADLAEINAQMAGESLLSARAELSDAIRVKQFCAACAHDERRAAGRVTPDEELDALLGW